MITTLVKYLGMLAIGMVLGYKDKIKGPILNKLALIQTIGMLSLLFVMGITIGMNKEIIANILTIGVKGGVITIFTVGFSIIGLRLISPIILGKGEINEP